MTDIYEAHLRTFLDVAESDDQADRVRTAAGVLDELDSIKQDWEALLDLAVAELYYGEGMTQVALGSLLGGRSHTTAGTRAKHGKKAKRSLEHVVAAAKRAARGSR